MISVKNIFSRFRGASLILIIILFSIAMSFCSPYFLTWDNIKTTVISMCCDGIVTIGMTIVLISGGIDLSVGAVLGLSGVVTGVLYNNGTNIFLAGIIAVLICIIIGVLNGLISCKTSIAPMITTLGTMNVARGMALTFTQGSPQSIKNMPEAFRFLGKGQLFGIPFIIVLFLFCVIILSFLLRKSVMMRKIFYVGSNARSAEFSGINVAHVKMGVYILSAFLAALAGILTASRFAVATPTAGTGSEMTAISAAVIGGASLSGGEGSIIGAVLGLLLLTLINNALVLLNVSVYWQQFISGGILLIAVLTDYYINRKKI